MDTEQLVISLIKTRREDDWWDFKREHHHDKEINKALPIY